ncbi:Cap1p [Rhodotorula paludigena]|uniref:Cap1p n=1 Tax=Rhodotorula paludigena TaxID=86838 RepID=UPI003181DE37
MADAQTVYDTAAEFLLQSPPGELNDVLADLRTIVSAALPSSSPDELDRALLPALKQYHAEQYTVVDLPAGEGAGGKTLVTPVSRLGAGEEGAEERHVDPKGATSFAFDAATASASSPLPLSPSPDSETESLRSALESVLAQHVANHYHQGVSAVFALADPAYPEEEEGEEPAPIAEEGQKEKVEGQDAIGSIAEDVEGTVEESAEVAAETAEAESEAMPAEGVEDAQVEGEQGAEAAPAGEEETKEGDEAAEKADVDAAGDDKMDEGTPAPAAAQDVAAPAPAPAAEPEKPKVARPSRLFGLYLVGNKYNPSNYWTGRWRATYTLDHAKGTLEGTAQINIHYYEQGNVQLTTTLKSSTTLSPSPPAEAVIAALKASESSFQRRLGEAYGELSDTSFRGLRRALPKTRSKVDWDKVGGYKLGQQLGGQ